MKRALFTLFCTLSALAQWPTDPAQNLLICDHPGEQALPKIAALSDGGCYIAWQDLISGSYDTYLQRLDANGLPQWENPCGILISNHPQETWLTDWDVAADVSDNCIIAINDIRNGPDRDITVYSIGPQQEFLWGADGIALSNNDGFEPDPQIEPMDNGDIVFAWQEETNIHLRRLDAQGADVWNPPVITFTQANGVSIPRLAEADSGAVILSYLAQQGTSFMSPRYLYLRKYDVSGNALWNPAGVPIMTTNGIGIQMRPDVIHDGLGGAYSYWYDARGNVHHVYVQRVVADGNVAWNVNGVQCDLTAGELQMSPSAVLASNGIVVFYETKNSSQSQGGLSAQYLDVTGAYSWESGGATISPLLPDEHVFNVQAFVQGDNFAVFFSQYDFGSATETLLRASQLSFLGTPTWTPIIKDLCSVDSEKGRPHACVNVFGQILAAWPDSRTANNDIYAQNINADGSLGALQTEPPTIEIVSPTPADTSTNGSITLIISVENFSLDPGVGDGSVVLLLNSIRIDTFNTEEPQLVSNLLPGQNELVVYLIDRDGQPLDPAVMDLVQFYYDFPFPSITITSPQNGAWFLDPVPVYFIVEDFVISDSMGDGHVRVTNIREIWTGEQDTIVFDHYSLDSINAFSPMAATNHVRLSLVDNSGNELDPQVFDSVSVDIGEIAADPIPDLLPTDFSITATYPNPFNASTTIEYALPVPAHVSLDIIDITGRNVRTLLDSEQPAGQHRLTFDADDLASGLYFVRLTAPGRTDTRKIVLLK